MTMKQQFDESATEFLRRLRKQMDLCDAVGCQLYNNQQGEELVSNIALQGLSSNHRLYSAMIAELKAQYRRNPENILLVDLEEIFFNINNSNNTEGPRKKERANVIYKGHKSNSKKGQQSNPSRRIQGKDNKDKKKDLSHIICWICKKPGHYANKCPERDKKEVTISPKLLFKFLRALNHWIKNMLLFNEEDIKPTKGWFLKWNLLYPLIPSLKRTFIKVYTLLSGDYTASGDTITMFKIVRYLETMIPLLGDYSEYCAKDGELPQDEN